ncbi:AAA family ATPase [Corynebacterium diphtheriae]|nr:AAA family ATPase [Corynebacterium diphtheriae]CAB0700962.1 AAA family ATPase [Corynebacterium diphtheriae]CAB0701358.1 AAA family ATPase [Corynebacterium diphtheriae]CAB0701823.1 AAA family ATPase [Corynebacterium diphtheriae]CAB0705120.1 AAA family ATPase [Corynebacterium diphtheriae]
MIRSVSLSELPSFGEDEVLNNLTTVNYVFGPNGSGKTSISRSLTPSLNGIANDYSHVKWGRESQTVKVYNRDYVNKTFTKAEERGVFLLGEDSKETFNQIKELQDALQKAEGKIENFRSMIETAQKELEVMRKDLRDKVWDRRSDIPEVLRHEMTGLNGGRDRCLELTLDKAAEFPDRGEETFESLLSKARVVFSNEIDEQPPIPPVPVLEWNEGNLREALRTPIVGSADVPLSDMIERLGISDWVREGVEHFHDPRNSATLCPFCQQTPPQNLSEQLTRLFDDTYQEKRSEIEQFKRELEAFDQSLTSYKKQNFDVLQYGGGSAEINQAFETVEVGLKSIATSLEQKMMKPSDAIEVGSVAQSHAVLVSIVDRANEEIKENNTIIRTRKDQRSIIIDNAWREFARGHLNDLITTFLKEKEKVDKKVNGLQEKIEQQEGFCQSHESKLRQLRAQTTSSEATIETINEMLEMSQFHSFKLAKAHHTKDGYRIVRDDAQTADIATLSEGERTFVTFLYFYHSLSEVKQEGETEKICAIIDDPISSLDGDIMFVVSALTRDLIQKVRQQKHDRVSQVFLLTHNTRFHEEVSYNHKGEESPEVKFYRIKKFSPEPNQMQDCGRKNPIRSAYQELWDEVAAARLCPDSRRPWLPNILRRILESYFSTLGGQRNLYEIGEGLPPSEKALHDALIAWSHSGSHTIVGAEVYAQSSVSNERWLEAFERVFQKTSNGAHWGHFEMMMREAEKYVQ